MKPLKNWIEEEVNIAKKKGMRYLSEQYFHRVESRPTFIDSSYMFSPADGTILGAFENVKANDTLIQVKGVNFSLKDLMQDPSFGGKKQEFLVVSIFMSFYDQHQNYLPFAGNRTYIELPSLRTYNKPMLPIEKGLLEGIINPEFQETYLRENNREISTINSPALGPNFEYNIVRIGDYEVDTFLNYGQPNGLESTFMTQNQRFGMIAWGSQCILVLPQSKREDEVKFQLMPGVEVGMHVKCKEDALVKIIYPS